MNLKRILGSLTFRFMFTYVAGLSLAVFFVLALIFASFSYSYFRTNSEDVKSESARLVAIYRQDGIAALEKIISERRLQSQSETFEEYQAREQQFRYLLADANHTPIVGTLNRWPANIYDSWAVFQYHISFAGSDSSSSQLVAHTVTLDNGQLLLVARHYGYFITFERIILIVLLRSMVVTIIMGAIGGAVVAGRGLRDMEAINRSVQSIMQGDLAQRISLKSSRGDFRKLIITFNRMLDRIQMLMEGVRQVSDNIAHDLRTPLTRLRNHLTSLQELVTDDKQKNTVQALLDEADSLLATFNALLRITQVESGNRRAGFRELDVSVILHDVIELYEPLAAEKNLEIQAHLASTLPLSGDRDLLFQAFANLFDNAIKYTPEGGSISVSAQVRDAKVWVDVADNGWGIPAADRDKVFRRFYRVESSRSLQPGNGLGLSLVNAVVNLHSGSITLADNHPGLAVTVCLPALA